MYKSLLLPLVDRDGDTDALDLAVRLAAFHGAQLSVLVMIDLPPPVVDPWGLMPDPVTAQSHADLRERLAAETIDWEARTVEAMSVGAPRAAARESFDCDLVVLGGAIGDTVESTVPREYFSSLLLEAGCPVLVVPPRCAPEVPTRCITVAWQPTREAARAVRAALPLLRAAKTVDVLAIDDGKTPDAEPSGRRLIGYLRRHGVEASWVARPAGEETVATRVLQYARHSRSQLLVVGGYGHSRLREWALGGVTRELLIGADQPVLYAH
ncbi:universal stress protein [Lysobacter antibioticus]|uniref:universal stress protein n=1 Tax=Lysobacter antibioticus TaxID=84531 RepID=UPI00034AD70B|nr:universal stress protein [Lysobacter antibioticus]